MTCSLDKLIDHRSIVDNSFKRGVDVANNTDRWIVGYRGFNGALKFFSRDALTKVDDRSADHNTNNHAASTNQILLFVVFEMLLDFYKAVVHCGLFLVGRK